MKEFHLVVVLLLISLVESDRTKPRIAIVGAGLTSLILNFNRWKSYKFFVGKHVMMPQFYIHVKIQNCRREKI